MVDQPCNLVKRCKHYILSVKIVAKEMRVLAITTFNVEQFQGFIEHFALNIIKYGNIPEVMKCVVPSC